MEYLHGTTICLKQTTGIIFVIGFAFYKILYIREKNQVKTCIKIVINRLIGALIPILIFGGYLTIFDLWTDFIDYAILGITTFSNVIPYYLLFINGNYGIRILAGIYLLQMAFMIIKYLVTLTNKKIKEKQCDNTLFILLIYSSLTSIVMIPIADKMHFGIGALCTIISFIYCIYYYIKKKTNEKIKNKLKKVSEIAVIVIFFIGICYSITLLLATFQSKNIRTDIKHFKYSRIENDIYERVVEVREYIKEQEKERKRST